MELEEFRKRFYEIVFQRDNAIGVEDMIEKLWQDCGGSKIISIESWREKQRILNGDDDGPNAA